MADIEQARQSNHTQTEEVSRLLHDTLLKSKKKFTLRMIQNTQYTVCNFPTEICVRACTWANFGIDWLAYATFSAQMRPCSDVSRHRSQVTA